MSCLKYFCLFFLLLGCGFADIPTITAPPDPLPVKIDTTFYLWNLSRIDEKDGTFSAEVYVILKWKDERLASKGSRETLIYTEEAVTDKFKEIWWPEIDFVNASTLEQRNKTLFISPEGNVEYSLKVLGSFFNTMDLTLFPFDEQNYEIHIESFLWNSKTLEFVVKQVDSANLANFSIRSLRPDQLFATVKNVKFMSENYSDFGVTVHFVRNPAFFNYQILIPLVIVLFITCAMFYLDIGDLSTRLFLGQGSILVLVAMKFMINQELPSIDYLIPIDYIFFIAYFCCCLTVALSCIDFTLWKKNEPLARRINKHALWIPLLLFFILYGIVLLFAQA